MRGAAGVSPAAPGKDRSCCMAQGKPVAPALKAEVVGKIRDEGMSVTVASATYGLSAQAIYAWLREGVADGN